MPALECEQLIAGEPVALVGHSYGAALALGAAVQWHDRVRVLALHERNLLALVWGDT